MYDNIGGKIKNLAKAIVIVEAIVSIIIGIVLMSTDEDLMLTGLLVMLCGPIIAWVSSWPVYGYGQLIENSDIIAEEYNRKNATYQKTVAKNTERKQSQQRKEVKALIANPDVTDDKFIDVVCPNCQAELSYTKEQLKNNDGVTCPMCDTSIKLN